MIKLERRADSTAMGQEFPDRRRKIERHAAFMETKKTKPG
jgi:hypothetical protein